MQINDKKSTTTVRPLRDVLAALKVMKEWLKRNPDPTDPEYVFNKLIPKYERVFAEYNERRDHYQGLVTDAENLNCAKDPATGIRVYETFDQLNQFGQKETVRQLAFTPEGAVARDKEIRAVNLEWIKESEIILDKEVEVPIHYFDPSPYNFSKTQLSILNGFVLDWQEE